MRTWPLDLPIYRKNQMRDTEDLKQAIHYGAVKRIRPKVMTVLTTIIGLSPIMWASTYEIGSDAMKRMAAPMIGGLVTSFILELTIYPAIFLLWKGTEVEGWRALIPGGSSRRRQNAGGPIYRSGGRWLRILLAVLVAALLAWATWNWVQGPAQLPPMKPVVSQEVAGGQVEILAPEGRFTSGDNTFRITIQTSQGKIAEVQDVRVEFHMPAMGSMPAMRVVADTETPGVGEISAQVALPMAGEWQMRLSFVIADQIQNLRMMIRAQ